MISVRDSEVACAVGQWSIACVQIRQDNYIKGLKPYQKAIEGNGVAG